MPRRNWERIKAALETTNGVPEDELDAILAHLCADDPSMAAFIRNLVRNDLDSSTASAPLRNRVFADGSLVAGRLRVVRFIDRGAMGEVYEAYDERLKIRVAVKTIRTELIARNEALARFEREIRVAREVTHPNLCRVFDFVEHRSAASTHGDPIPCYTMELIQGESLAAYLSRERPLTPSIALPLLRQMAAGLDALHARGIIHRDLKPSNIMLAPHCTGESRVVLMDFGLAKLLDGEEEMFQTRTDLHAGAPYFMAPELLRESAPSVASDLYAFGLIVDEMVTRSRAFSMRSLQSLYFAKLWEAPIPPGERSADLPANWQNAILRGISFQPEDRYCRAGDLIGALETPTTVASPPPRPAPLPPWKKPLVARALVPISRRPFLFSGLGATLLSCGILLALARTPGRALVQVYDIENATGNTSLNYLCKGTANELIRRLSEVKRFQVLPMRGTRGAATGTKTGRVAVEGMLLGSGDRVRLNVLLTDIPTGQTFDSEMFDHKGDDSLQMENSLAINVVSKIENHLVSGTLGSTISSSSIFPLISRLRFGFLKQAISGPTTNGSAFDAYMRGRQLMDEYSQASLEAAILYLRHATEDDPSFALGHATLAEAQLNMMTFMRTPQQEALVAAHRSAASAIALNPGLAEAQAAQAYVMQSEWDWYGAAAHFRKALDLKPVYPAARRRYAGLLLQFGRIVEAIPLADQAFSEDPYDRGAIPAIGLYYYLAGRYEDAARFLEAQIGENDMQAARHNLGDALAEAALRAQPAERKAYFEKALAQAARVTALEQKAFGAAPMGDEMFAHYYTLMGEGAAAEPYFDKMKVQMHDKLASPAIVAWIYALRGERERALDLLEQALAERDRRMFYVKLFPALQSLHGTTRFQAIIASMRLQ
jgi:serine/threonine protein kinase/tetratricopeptide (TPR) repeat protein